MDCALLHCLWSETEQSNIDLWLEPFTPIRQGQLSVRGACPRPKGGQTGQGTQAPAAVAFVVTMYNNGLTAAQCLLELFRCGKQAHALPQDISCLSVQSWAASSGARLSCYSCIRCPLRRPDCLSTAWVSHRACTNCQIGQVCSLFSAREFELMPPAAKLSGQCQFYQCCIQQI